jgi:hypothetical protein
MFLNNYVFLLCSFLDFIILIFENLYISLYKIKKLFIINILRLTRAKENIKSYFKIL